MCWFRRHYCATQTTVQRCRRGIRYPICAAHDHDNGKERLSCECECINLVRRTFCFGKVCSFARPPAEARGTRKKNESDADITYRYETANVEVSHKDRLVWFVRLCATGPAELNFTPPMLRWPDATVPYKSTPACFTNDRKG